MTIAAPPAAARAVRPAAPAGSPFTRWRRTRANELLVNLTLRDIRSQYKRTALGRLWSFINPLAQLAVFSVVFGDLMKAQPPVGLNSGFHNFTLFLAAGLIPWTFFSSSITTGMNALLVNAGLLTKVYFPRQVLVISSILALASTFGIELVVVLVIMVIAGGPLVLAYVPMLLVVVVLTGVFCTGVALMLSVALVYFRDTQHFIAIFMQIWFYASAVVYPLTLVAPPNLSTVGFQIYRLNPGERFVELYREMLYDFKFPGWSSLLVCTLWAAVSAVAGALVFRRFSGRVVEEL